MNLLSDKVTQYMILQYWSTNEDESDLFLFHLKPEMAQKLIAIRERLKEVKEVYPEVSKICLYDFGDCYLVKSNQYPEEEAELTYDDEDFVFLTAPLQREENYHAFDTCYIEVFEDEIGVVGFDSIAVYDSRPISWEYVEDIANLQTQPV